MPYDVFISYAQGDKPTADAICGVLESERIRCWIAPRDVTPGSNYASAIVSAIAECEVLVLVFSAGANRSPHVMREVERALSKGLTIVPFRVEDVSPVEALEYFVSASHWLDALTPPLEAHIRRLAEVVRAHLDAPSPQQAKSGAGREERPARLEIWHRATLTADAEDAAAALRSPGLKVSLLNVDEERLLHPWRPLPGSLEDLDASPRLVYLPGEARKERAEEMASALAALEPPIAVVPTPNEELQGGSLRFVLQLY